MIENIIKDALLFWLFFIHKNYIQLMKFLIKDLYELSIIKIGEFNQLATPSNLPN